MKKLLLSLAATALLLAACGGPSSSVAATVDGTDITVGEVESLISSEESTIPIDRFAQVLGFEIQNLIMIQGARDEWGIDVTQSEVDVEIETVYEEIIPEGQAREEFLESNGITEQFIREIARQRATVEAIRSEFEVDETEVSQDEIEDRLQQAVAALTEVCVSHILVSTEEAADEVLDRLDAGESFEDLATELSEDPGSAENLGDLGCAMASRYVPEFRDATIEAPIGEILEAPVESQFGFHVIFVNDRTEPEPGEIPTEDEISDALRQELLTQEISDWFLGVVEQADVTVDEQYGTWQTSPQPTVIPPSS